MTATGELLRRAAARARALWDEAAEARQERDRLMILMDAEEARLREIAAEAGMHVGSVQRIIVRGLPAQREAPHDES